MTCFVARTCFFDEAKQPFHNKGIKSHGFSCLNVLLCTHMTSDISYRVSFAVLKKLNTTRCVGLYICNTECIQVDVENQFKCGNTLLSEAALTFTK